MLCIRLHYTNMFKELTVVWSTESKSCAGLNPPPYPLKCFPMSFLVFFPSFTLLCSCLFVCEYAAGSLPLTTGSQLCSPAYIQTLKREDQSSLPGGLQTVHPKSTLLQVFACYWWLLLMSTSWPFQDLAARITWTESYFRLVSWLCTVLK